MVMANGDIETIFKLGVALVAVIAFINVIKIVFTSFPIIELLSSIPHIDLIFWIIVLLIAVYIWFAD